MTEADYTLSWVLAVVRQSFRQQPGSIRRPSSLQRLWAEFEKSGVPGIVRVQNVAASGRAFEYHLASPRLQDYVVEAFFHLLRSGLIVERPQPDYFSQTPSHGVDEYRWTERGQSWIDGAEPVPEDAAGQMRFLKTLIPNLDPVVEQYMIEGVTTFERQTYFAAAVMLGAASEKAFYNLADALLGAMVAGSAKNKLASLITKRRMHELLTLVRYTITTSKNMPYSVSEGAASHLLSLSDAVRIQRNDAVHPMNATVSAASIRMLLLALPYALANAAKLTEWLTANPNIIYEAAPYLAKRDK